MPTPSSSQTFAKRLLGLYGGRQNASEALERRFRAIAERWDQDAGTIGRILRAHLFVEHYLTRYLQARNPMLPDIARARLSFAQKMALVGTSDRSVAHLAHGLERLNQVRNRIAHTLKAEVTLTDSRIFLSIGIFREMRRTLAAPGKPSDEPITVLDDFARHAGIMLEAASSPDRELWAKTVRGCCAASSS
jgi:hypothetical protein